METLVFNVPHFRLYEPNDEQLLAANIPEGIKGKPRFCVEMMLARLDVPNKNNHRLKREEVEKALVALGEKPFIPANLNHETMPFGTSTALWIDDKGKTHPELMLRAVYWQRYIDDAKLEEIMAAYDAGTLGASWEIDPPYSLKPDAIDAKILDVMDFGINGFGIIVGKEPAEAATKGTAQISAQLDLGDGETLMADINKAKEDQIARSTQYKIAIKEGGNITNPNEDILEEQYGDGVNFRFPIHPEHIEAEICAFNEQGRREKGGYTVTEWAKIGNRIAKLTGYRYKAGKIELADVDMIRLSRYSELPVDMLHAIRCPVCGERGTIKKLDFPKGVFLLECCNSEFDRELISHQYEVGITVTPVGQTASYQLVASEEDYGDDIGDMGEEIRVMLRTTEEVFNTMEFTDEQKVDMQKEIDRAVKEILDKQKADEAALAKQREDMDAEIEKQVAEKVEAAKADIAEEVIVEYKKSEEVVAKRIDEANEIAPFESEEAKLEAKVLLADMTDDKFEDYKKIRTLEAKIAEASGEEGDEEGEEKPKDSLTAMASGSAKNKIKTDEPDWSAFRRI